MNKETQKKLSELQNIEQNMNSLIAQKQQFQAQNLEIENALSQIKDTKKVFRILGNIMVSSTKEKVKKELTEKKEVVDLRLKAIDKQEQKIRKRAEELQEEVLKEMKGE